MQLLRLNCFTELWEAFPNSGGRSKFRGKFSQLEQRCPAYWTNAVFVHSMSGTDEPVQSWKVTVSDERQKKPNSVFADDHPLTGPTTTSLFTRFKVRSVQRPEVSVPILADDFSCRGNPGREGTSQKEWISNVVCFIMSFTNTKQSLGSAEFPRL